MRFLRDACVALAAALVFGAASGCSSATNIPAASASRPYVVLVSFDAFRHDYIDRYHPAAFEAVASRGVRARALIPSFPSKTFPNHYTLVTGLYPGDHGIVGNAFYDPARRAWYRLADKAAVGDSSWYGGEPIWVTAEKNGVRTGAYFWTGSEAAIEGVRPTYWTKYDAKVPNARRVDEAMGWMRKPADARPHLLLMYFSDVDDTTHRYGPDAPQTATAVASVNAALQRLTDSLRALPYADSINVVLVSDHGMAAILPQHSLFVTDLLVGAGIDTSGVEISDNGPTLSLWFNGDTTRLRAAHAVLDRSLQHAHTYLRSETPARWHVRDNPRAGDLIIVADDGWLLERKKADRPQVSGAHGFDPQLADMQALFIAAGPNVRPEGVIAPFENVNVYPFIAALLRLDRVPRVDGSLDVLGRLLR